MVHWTTVLRDLFIDLLFVQVIGESTNESFAFGKVNKGVGRWSCAHRSWAEGVAAFVSVGNLVGDTSPLSVEVGAAAVAGSEIGVA